MDLEGLRLRERVLERTKVGTPDRNRLLAVLEVQKAVSKSEVEQFVLPPVEALGRCLGPGGLGVIR